MALDWVGLISLKQCFSNLKWRNSKFWFNDLSGSETFNDLFVLKLDQKGYHQKAKYVIF